MLLPPRFDVPSRRSTHRARLREPDWTSFIAGTGAFLLIACACLYFVAHFAP